MKKNIAKLVSFMEYGKTARITMRNGAIVVCKPDATSDDYQNPDIDINVISTTDPINYPVYDAVNRVGIAIDDSDIASVEEYTE